MMFVLLSPFSVPVPINPFSFRLSIISFTSRPCTFDCHAVGMRSVPPRGSGWARRLVIANCRKTKRPTRYRVVVLTSARRVLPAAKVPAAMAHPVGACTNSKQPLTVMVSTGYFGCNDGSNSWPICVSAGNTRVADADGNVSWPSPGSSTPSPGRSTPSPRPSMPSPGRSKPSPGSSTPSPGSSTPSPDSSKSSACASSPALGRSKSTPGPSTSARPSTTAAPGRSGATPKGSTAASARSIPAHGGSARLAVSGKHSCSRSTPSWRSP